MIQLNIRCSEAEKRAWVKAANEGMGGNLSRWIKQALNAAANWEEGREAEGTEPVERAKPVRKEKAEKPGVPKETRKETRKETPKETVTEEARRVLLPVVGAANRGVNLDLLRHLQPQLKGGKK